MKSKYFQYAVLSTPGFMLAGLMSFDKLATVEQATSQAGQEAESIARDLEKPFDPMNYSVVVKPTSNAKFGNNETNCWKIDPK
jgi:hypothetical protein